MELDIQTGKRLKLAGVIVALVLVAIPGYRKSVQRSEETLVKNNRFALRTVVDEYTFDKQKAPRTMQDLVDAGYLRNLPPSVPAW